MAAVEISAGGGVAGSWAEQHSKGKKINTDQLVLGGADGVSGKIPFHVHIEKSKAGATWHPSGASKRIYGKWIPKAAKRSRKLLMEEITVDQISERFRFAFEKANILFMIYNN